MPIVAICAECEATYNCSDRKAGTDFQCQKCDATVHVPPIEQGNGNSPANEDVAPDESEAETYGFGAPLEERARPSLDYVPDEATVDSPSVEARVRKRRKKRGNVTWRDILRAPLEDEIIATTVSLVMNYVLWAIGYLGLAFIGFLVALIPVIGPIIYLVAMVVYGLRMMAMIFEEYFAVCNRCATGSMAFEVNMTWLRVLGFALAVQLIAFFPFLISLVVGGIAIDVSPFASPIALLCWAVSYVWAILYAPMGIGVAAVEDSIDPRIVVTWIRKCMPDYLIYFLVVSVFTGVVFLTYLLLMMLIGFVLSNVGAGAQSMLAPFTAILIPLMTMFVFQFAAIASYAMLGTLLQKHRDALGFDSETD